MAILSVGVGQQYATIASAVAAAQSGDTIDVQGGTYTNDFTTIRKSIALQAVGGQVVMNATAQPPDGKAILTEGGAGLTVSIDGFTFTNASVPDQNGAGIRYEGGTLHISHSGFFDNQDGILAAADPTGVITIDSSEFGSNGVGGTGYTHNIYIGAVGSFSLTNSYVHDANVGHEVKSRAANNTITGNTIADNDGTASYEIDLPNGGNALISNNTIQQGPNTQNPNVIAYAEEGFTGGTSLVVADNTIVNDLGSGPALWNASAVQAQFTGNEVYGFGGNALVRGPATVVGTTVEAARPTVGQSIPVTDSVAPTLYTDVGTAIWRFFDSSTGTQFLTASPTERATVLATRPDLVSEGQGFGGLQANDPGAAPVFRFFDTRSGTHFMTASAAERDQVVATRPDLTFEGIGFYETASAKAGSVPVYRFFDTHAGTHFFTDSAAERASVLATRPDLAPEGIAFYAPAS